MRKHLEAQHHEDVGALQKVLAQCVGDLARGLEGIAQRTVEQLARIEQLERRSRWQEKELNGFRNLWQSGSNQRPASPELWATRGRPQRGISPEPQRCAISPLSPQQPRCTISPQPQRCAISPPPPLRGLSPEPQQTPPGAPAPALGESRQAPSPLRAAGQTPPQVPGAGACTAAVAGAWSQVPVPAGLATEPRARKPTASMTLPMALGTRSPSPPGGRCDAVQGSAVETLKMAPPPHNWQPLPQCPAPQVGVVRDPTTVFLPWATLEAGPWQETALVPDGNFVQKLRETHSSLFEGLSDAAQGQNFIREREGRPTSIEQRRHSDCTSAHSRSASACPSDDGSLPPPSVRRMSSPRPRLASCSPQKAASALCS